MEMEPESEVVRRSLKTLKLTLVCFNFSNEVIKVLNLEGELSLYCVVGDKLPVI